MSNRTVTHPDGSTTTVVEEHRVVYGTEEATVSFEALRPSEYLEYLQGIYPVVIVETRLVTTTTTPWQVVE